MYSAAPTNLDHIWSRLERDKHLNTKLILAVAVVWFLLACVIATLGGSGGNVNLVFICALYHFLWGYAVVRHMFNYVLPKTIRLPVFTKWIRDFWRWYILGLAALLLLMGNVILGTVCSFMLGAVATKKLTVPLRQEYHSGSRPMLFRWLKDDYMAKLSQSMKGIYFGGLILPFSEAHTHFRITGAAGSGKTNLLRLMMQSVLPKINSEGLSRALIYDPKSEFLPLIAGMGVNQNSIRVLNPFDDRAYAWDLAKDLTRDRDANELANILIPEKPNSQGNTEFFDQASRRILSSITRFFIRSAPGAWSLRDLVQTS